MRELNQRYLSASNQRVLRGRFTIAMHFDDAGTDIVYFTSHDDTQRPTGELVQAVDGCVQNFAGATQKINPKTSESSIGSISFELVNKDRQITDILAAKSAEGKSPRKKKVEVYYGYGIHQNQFFSSPVNFDLELLDWLDYEKQFTMILQDYEAGGTSLRFVCEDVQRLERVDVFVPQATTLAQTVNDYQLLIPINESPTSNKFQLVAHDASYSDRPSQTVGYVKIGKEVICHNGIIEDGTLGVCLNVLQRGALNTLQAGHESDPSAEGDRKTKVEELIYLEGPSLKILYAIQTGILYGQGGATLPAHWHQGIPAALVRLSDYLNADPLLWEPAANTGRKLRFDGLKKVSGDRFIVNEILPAVVGIRPVYSDGSIGFKKLNAVLSESDYVFELNDDNIVSCKSLHHRLQDVINTIIVDWDYSFLNDQFLQSNGVLDAASIAKYGEGEIKRLALKGIRSSAQTDQDLRTIFDGFRNRFAGGGIELQAEVLPRVNQLEVGDLVRFRTSQLIDPITGDEFDRVCEVQQITPDSRSGRSKLSLFASVEKAGDFELITANTVLDDDWYSSEGTALNTVLTMSGNTVTANGTLNGGATLGAGIFYHLGDLVIPDGIVVFIFQNVQIRVRGTVTRNGQIRGVARGFAGGGGGTAFTVNNSTYYNSGSQFTLLETNEQAGQVGFFGVTQAARQGVIVYRSGVMQDVQAFRPWRITTGRNTSADSLAVINRNGSISDSVNGLDLRGTSGNGAPPVVEMRGGFMPSGNTHQIRGNGGAGGAGGAGLMIVCRGEAVGASGMIDLSGAAGGASPVVVIPATWSTEVASCGGGGGAAGAFYLLVDGNGSTGTNTGNIRQNRGLAYIDSGAQAGVPSTSNDHHDTYLGSSQPAGRIHLGRSLTLPVSMGEGGFRVQYIRPSDSISDGPIEIPKYQLQPISGLTLTSGNATLLGSRDGTIRERVLFEFTAAGEAQASGYEVQAKESTEPDSDYRTVAIVTIPRGYFDVTELLTYNVRVRAITYDPDALPSAWVVGTHAAVGKSAAPSNPSSFAAYVLKNGVSLQVGPHPDADFLEHIFYEDGVEIYRGNQTLSAIGYRPIGARTYTVRARDRSGNLSAGLLTSEVTISRPTAPSVAVLFSGPDVVFVITGGETSYSIASYHISQGSLLVAQANSSRVSVRVDWLGTGVRTFVVTMRDAGGNWASPQATVPVNIVGPSAPIVSASVSLNLVALSFRAIRGSLPIDRFDFFKGATFGAAVKFAEKSGDSDQTIFQEAASGSVNYWVVAYDTAGNASTASSVTAVIAMPADFDLLLDASEFDEGFDGTITNGYVTRQGKLVLMVDETETWSEYAANGYATFQAEVDAGFPMFLDPSLNTGSYEKVYDLGSVIASAFIYLSMSQTISGDATRTITLGYSNDGVTYTNTAADSATGTSFRYVRVLISFSGAGSNDYVAFSDIRVRVTSS